jgi:uncharacterized surface protein with fasciclin (FAS1) repeats
MKDIVDTAVDAGFKTLATAVTAAGLVDTLKLCLQGKSDDACI